MKSQAPSDRLVGRRDEAPNIPEHPVTLVYEKKRRVFTFAPSIYWGGGVLSVMEIFCDWPY